MEFRRGVSTLRLYWSYKVWENWCIGWQKLEWKNRGDIVWWKKGSKLQCRHAWNYQLDWSPELCCIVPCINIYAQKWVLPKFYPRFARESWNERREIWNKWNHRWNNDFVLGGELAGAIMTGMTPEKSGKNLIRPDFPDPNGIPAGKALCSSNFSRFPGQKLCSERLVI